MGIESAKSGKLLYHLTKLKNLPSIFENGLVARQTLLENRAAFDDIADSEIISKRTQLGLDKYVPFHFHPFSAFDVAVKSTYGNDEFVYICISRDGARFNKFKILPMHPLSMQDCALYEYDEGFGIIDWDVLTQKGLSDEYSKRVKMAECLTDLVIPAAYFQSIAVKNEQTKEIVEELCRKYNLKPNSPYVNIRTWF
ncbi:DarT ssDNA thymidine ADP-ribosyltransferase family protein [Paenibacillus septentrionalis]|uniref:DarT ssDNA thymidine ADP-ribosyltransferase family protein n=1 Tax=Paenibacillus septentrionalis TaxID=429342 RepID=A0ABW1V5T7_9BACL